MRSIKTALAAFFILFSAGVFAQETEQQTEQREGGHINENKFRQLYQEFSTPNQYRTGSGAPGPAYYQNEADYKMDIELD
ncbi:M1 family peptidase, partial [Tamlana crocina]|nr:M1 family peptidase [Tamlana crocina]